MLKRRKMIRVLVFVFLLAFLLAGCKKIPVESSYDNLIASKNDGFYVSVNQDGTVSAFGKTVWEYDFSGWENITSIECSGYRIAGLKKDGTVILTGLTLGGECDVQDWSEIVDVTMTSFATYGLKKDGTIIYTVCVDIEDEFLNEIRETVVTWEDIVDIETNGNTFVGIKSNGELMVVTESNKLGEELKTWKDIKSISLSRRRAIALKNNGEVLMCQYTNVGPDLVCAYPYDEFEGAVKVVAGENVFACLMPDGTIKAIDNLEIPAGYKQYDSGLFEALKGGESQSILFEGLMGEQAKKKFWRANLQGNVVDIAVGESKIFALKSNGKVFIE